MTQFELEAAPSTRRPRAPVSVASIDSALTAQLVVAWAGEGGEEKRLGWWRSDLVSEFGGQDLLKRVAPRTWEWAVLQGAREAARRRDAELRAQDHDADRIISLFRFGFELDERIEERLQDLKRGGQPPQQALPGLAIVTPRWDRGAFYAWVAKHGTANTTAAPVGRRIKGAAPEALDQQVQQLLAGLAPEADSYPLPHFRSTP